MREPLPCSERDTLRSRLREALACLDERLEIVAEDVLGLDSRIELVARDSQGGLVVALAAERGRDLERFADALAQGAWLEPRSSDWLKIAPDLGIRPERGVRLLLAAEEFDPRTLAAAGRLGDAAPILLRIVAPPASGRRPGAPKLTAPGTGGAAPRPTASVFRTGLDPLDR
jgi:hypothetical protein